jgi:glycosyltransferase involved in cell wall biosynthesis
MKILLIAPQPFFINRGTPLAVRNLCRVLGECGHQIDLLTSHIGEEIQLHNITIIRTCRLPFGSISAGFSWKKPLLDIAIAWKMFNLVRKNSYDVIHCVEESAYIASLLKWTFGAPYICDVDSSIPCQLKEKGGLTSLLAPIAGIFEKRALRKSLCAVTVCRALTNIVTKSAPETKVFQLEDPPISDDRRYSESELNSLREKLGAETKKIVLYMGNFESYQGVDLLMHAFARVSESFNNAILLLIGGSPADVREKQLLAQKLSIRDQVHFTGLLPPDETTIYLQAADVLVSPRTKGENTPMKIYTYMAAGSAILATDMFTHTQVLDHESALLTQPDQEAMAKGLEKLLNDDRLINRLAKRALEIVNEKYSFPAYTQKVKKIYLWVENQLRKNTG